MAETKGTKEASEQQRQQNQGTESKPQSQSIQSAGRGGAGQRRLVRREPFAPSPWSSNPWALMNRYAEEMERLFEDLGFGRGMLAPFGAQGLSQRGFGETGETTWSPQIDVYEREGQIVVHADLPGLSKDDVKVDITDDALTIEGERRREHEERREGFYRSERSYGTFYRSIPLPEGVDSDNAKATFRDGVLEVTIPAPEEARRRRRQIQIGEDTRPGDQKRADVKTTGK